MTSGWHRVIAAGRPRVAARQSAYSKPHTAQCAVVSDCLERVGRAGRVIAAHLAVERADQRAVGTQEPDQRIFHDVTLVRQRRRSASSSAEDADDDAGSARTTSTAEPGSPASAGRCSRVRCRSRRFTRLRTTALPTALLTTKPTSAGWPGARTSRWTTRVLEPQRRPERTARRKASLSLSRCADGSTSVVAAGAAVRRPGCCGPCGDAPTGSSGRRGCACAGGNRAPCDDDGCSAGRYACSRASLRCSFSWGVHSTGGMVRTANRVVAALGSSAGTAHPRACTRLGHGVVDMRHPSTRSDRPTVRALANQGQTQDCATTGEPVDDGLPSRFAGC